MEFGLGSLLEYPWKQYIENVGRKGCDPPGRARDSPWPDLLGEVTGEARSFSTGAGTDPSFHRISTSILTYHCELM